MAWFYFKQPVFIIPLEQFMDNINSNDYNQFVPFPVLILWETKAVVFPYCLKAFSLSSVYLQHILVFCNYSRSKRIWMLIAGLSLIDFCLLHMSHAAEAGFMFNVLERFVLQWTGLCVCYIVKWVGCWHIVGTIERRRFVFQVDVDFSVYVGSLWSKPNIWVDVFFRFSFQERSVLQEHLHMHYAIHILWSSRRTFSQLALEKFNGWQTLQRSQAINISYGNMSPCRIQPFWTKLYLLVSAFLEAIMVFKISVMFHL